MARQRVTLARWASGFPMGQQRYELSLASALAAQREHSSVDVRVVACRSMRSTLQGRRMPTGLVDALPSTVASFASALVYGPGPVHRLDLRLPPARREVITVHDLAPLRFPDEGRLELRHLRGIDRAWGVVCPSEFAASEIRAYASPRRVFVIPNGVDDRFFSATLLSADQRLELGLPQRYYLHAGGVSGRKNLAALAEAWRLVVAADPDVGLVLCGPPDPRRTALFADLPRTHLLGAVDDGVVPGIVEGAVAVVVPSTYEGFGLPALEALAVGTPVVAVNRGAVPEVLAGAGILVEPAGTSLAEGMLAAADATRGDTLREHAAGRTWGACAVEHLRVYEEFTA